ncbi:MAG: DUF6291 domain-containing protein [Prevotella sp.]|nr:DUF6291 domain-containing protein [Bacteroides sp.]MCM1445866.1 DUF6291 domain-containing protein [Prevotella sp.]
MKDTLILYRDWWEAIKSLPANLQPEAYNAICEYAFEGTQPTEPMICAVTALMRSSIDRDKAKWQEVRKKRQEAGRKGGLKTQSQPKQDQPKEANATTCKQKQPSESKPSEPKQEPQISTPEQPSQLEQDFEQFRKLYPGTKRGLKTEFENLKKKYPKTWRDIIPQLLPAVERLLSHHEAAKAAGQFTPHFANLATWINNARWEEEYPDIATSKKATPEPTDTDTQDDAIDFGGRQY